MTNFRKWLEQKPAKILLSTLAILLIVVLIVGSGVHLNLGSNAGNKTLTIGTIDSVYAAVTPDYTCDGTADNEQFQQAIDALPDAGGEIKILSGTYDFDVTVSRAIDGVTVSGVGKGVLINYNNSIAVFSAGTQAGWLFENFSTDNGGVAVTSATQWKIENCWFGSSYITLHQVGDTTGDMMYYNGTTWTRLAHGNTDEYLRWDGAGLDWQVISTGLSSSPEQGDLIYWSGTAWVSLAHGTSGQLLKTGGHAANPSWAAGLPTSPSTGDVVYWSGTAWTSIGIGADNYVLTSTGTIPNWEVAAGGGTSGDAFVTVAAADTVAVLKARADYVGTGTNIAGGDEVTIATALAASSTVVLMPGTFWVTHVTGQTYSILVASNKTLMGCGASSVIKIRNAEDANLSVLRNSDISGGNDHITIMNLKIDGNRAGQGVTGQSGIVFTKVGVSTITFGVKIIDCFIENCYIYGVAIYSSYNCIIRGNYFYNNDRGLVLNASHCNSIQGNTFAAQINDGIHMEGSSSRNLIVGNYGHSNGTYGFYIVGSYNEVVGNYAYKNGQNGIYLDHAYHCLVNGGYCTENSQEVNGAYSNIELSTDCDYNTIQGVTCRKGALTNKPGYGIMIAAADRGYNVIQGNDLRDAGSAANLYDAGTCTKVKNNDGTTPNQDKDYVYVKNTSGGSLGAGDVVVLKAVAAGYEVTTTTTQGDDKVYGMVAETIADTAYGLVQTLGKTVSLRVDGTTDIAIGDFLGILGTADYVTGTALFTNNSATVAGTDTVWTVAMVGRKIKNNTNGVWYKIASVESTISLTMSAVYAGTTTTSDPYTITVAGVSMKASAGDMCFAMALEAYPTDDSNGVIDALLISPRLI